MVVDVFMARMQNQLTTETNQNTCTNAGVDKQSRNQAILQHQARLVRAG